MVDTDLSYDDVLEEHRLLTHLMRDLKEFLRQPRPAPAEVSAEGWSGELASSLTRLHGYLDRHFDLEERSGFLEDLEAEHPRATGAVQALGREHAQILDGFRALLDAARQYTACEQPDQLRLRRRTLDAIASMTSHETRETRLLQNLMSEDIGAGD